MIPSAAPPGLGRRDMSPARVVGGAPREHPLAPFSMGPTPHLGFPQAGGQSVIQPTAAPPANIQTPTCAPILPGMFLPRSSVLGARAARTSSS